MGEGVIVEGEGSLRGRGLLLWDEAGVTGENVAIKQLSLENRFKICRMLLKIYYMMHDQLFNKLGYNC